MQNDKLLSDGICTISILYRGFKVGKDVGVVAEYLRPAALLIEIAMLLGLSCLSQLGSWHTVVYHKHFVSTTRSLLWTLKNASNKLLLSR